MAIRGLKAVRVIDDAWVYTWVASRAPFLPVTVKPTTKEQPAMSKTFIVLRRDTAGSLCPTTPKEYDNRVDAVAEAERLAGLHPGSEFVVFEAKSKSVFKNVHTEIL